MVEPQVILWEELPISVGPSPSRPVPLLALLVNALARRRGESLLSYEKPGFLDLKASCWILMLVFRCH